MGFSISSLISAPISLVTDVTGAVLGGAGTIVGQVGKLGGAAGGALAQTTSGLGAAVQNLRPAAGGVVPPPSSNLPLYIGGAAAALVLVLLLTGKRAPAPAAPPVPA